MTTQTTIMGLKRTSATRREQVEQAEQIYFCDLTGADLSGLQLSARSFFGCNLSECDLRGSFLENCNLEHCFVDEGRVPKLDSNTSTRSVVLERCNFLFDDAAPRVMLAWNNWAADVVEAIRSALQGEPERLFEAIRRRLSSGDSTDLSAMFALCAIFLGSARWERRQASLALLSDALMRASESIAPMRNAYLTLLLYRIGDQSDMVYYEALDLLDRFSPDDSVLAQVLGRMESPEPSDRKEALIGARRILGQRDCELIFPLDALERLLADPKQSADTAREALRTLCDLLNSLASDKGEFPGRFAPILMQLLSHDDERIRKETLRVVSHFHDWEGRKEVRHLLQDENEDLRNRAFMTLYRIMPAHEFLALLKDQPPNASCHAEVAAHQAYLRENGWTNSLISDDALRDLLASDDPSARIDGLYYASFLGDDRYRSEFMANLEHGDSRVRLAALRAVRWLDPKPTPGELQFLKHDPDDDVRDELERAFSNSQP